MTPDAVEKNYTISDEHINSLGLALIGRLHGDNLQIRCIEDAIDKGIFLQFNPASASLEETQFHELLKQTIIDIKSLLSLENDNWDRAILDEIYKYKHGQITSVNILGIDLAHALAHYDRADNLYQGHLALCKVLLGLVSEIQPFERQPLTPLGEEENQKMLSHQISGAQIAALIENGISPFGRKYSSVHFGKDRKDTVKKLAELISESLKEQSVDGNLLKNTEKVIEGLAEELVIEETSQSPPVQARGKLFKKGRSPGQ